MVELAVLSDSDAAGVTCDTNSAEISFYVPVPRSGECPSLRKRRCTRSVLLLLVVNLAKAVALSLSTRRKRVKEMHR